MAWGHLSPHLLPILDSLCSNFYVSLPDDIDHISLLLLQSLVEAAQLATFFTHAPLPEPGTCTHLPVDWEVPVGRLIGEFLIATPLIGRRGRSFFSLGGLSANTPFLMGCKIGSSSGLLAQVLGRPAATPGKSVGPWGLGMYSARSRPYARCTPKLNFIFCEC